MNSCPCNRGLSLLAGPLILISKWSTLVLVIAVRKKKKNHCIVLQQRCNFTSYCRSHQFPHSVTLVQLQISPSQFDLLLILRFDATMRPRHPRKVNISRVVWRGFTSITKEVNMSLVACCGFLPSLCDNHTHPVLRFCSGWHTVHNILHYGRISMFCQHMWVVVKHTKTEVGGKDMKKGNTYPDYDVFHYSWS